jgi:diguanylate cyclase (GGDEF)-like protein/PAS domain S-box-containing protein
MSHRLDETSVGGARQAARPGEALRRAEAKYRDLVEQLPLIVYIDEPNASSSNIYTSPQTTAILGYTPEDWATDPDLFTAILHPDDCERVLAEHAHAHTTGEPLRTDYRLIKRDGTVVWVHDEGTLVRDEDGAPVCLQGYMLDITGRKEREAAVRESEARVRAMLEAALDAVVTIDHAGAIVEFNVAAERVFGYERADVIGEQMVDLIVPPSQRQAHLRGLQQYLATGEGPVLGKRIEVTAMRADGSEFPIELSIVRVDGLEPPVLTASIRDIGERKKREEALLHTQAIVGSSFDAIIGHTPDGTVTSWNAAAERIFGYSADEMIGHSIAILVPSEREGDLDAVNRRLGGGELVEQFETVCVRKDGTRIEVESTLSPFMDGSGRIIGVSTISRDISARKQAELDLRRLSELNRHQAEHDGLTGLPNRGCFRKRVEQAIATADGNRLGLAVLLIDLDRFKEINDTLGHHCGDLILVELARRFESILRQSDTIARLGGDEFGMLLPQLVDSPRDVEQVLERILAALEQPFRIDELPLCVEASIGIALCPKHGTDVDLLLQRADIAMYAAKKAGVAHALYAEDIDHHDTGSLTLLSELPRAISDHELFLHYQPTIDLRTGEVTSVEALLRWRHPTRGPIPPSEFIPLAEHTGLIRSLTRFVLDEALGQNKRWEGQGHPLTVAVNLSMRNVHDPTLPSQVAELLREWDLPGARLTLEITESAIVSDPARAKSVIEQLSALGVTISIDDFGTGYTSLAYLARLALDQIKIDRSFVLNMHRDPKDAAIVRSIVTLGHDLGLEVIAEGVETKVAWDELALLGCDRIQGFYISRPLPANELSGLLRPNSKRRPSEAEAAA